MKRKLIFILLAILLISCSKEKDVKKILEENYDEYILSLDNPYLKLNLDKIDKNILILLHHRINKDEIKSKLNLTDSNWNERINNLFGNGLIKKKDEIFLPTFFILDQYNKKELIKFTDSLSKDLITINIDRLNRIKEETKKIFPNYSFNDISYFILGSVENDYFQLKNFQNEFIKAFVPQRGSEKFYLALIANNIYQQIKIYETTFYNYPKFVFITFSSNKFDYNIPTFPTSELTNTFGKNFQTGDSLFQIALIEEIIKLSKSSTYKPNQKILDGLKKFGIIKNNKLTIPVIRKNNLDELNKICEATRSDLINYFETRQTQFLKYYLNSDFKDEVSYKEWMIWIYKIISGKTINSLIEKNIIQSGIISPSMIVIK